MNEPVKFYMGRFDALDNFSAFQVKISRFESLKIRICYPVFMTAEHAYQYAKFLKPEMNLLINDSRFERVGESIRLDVTKARIQSATSPHEAKQIAKENKDLRREDWDQVKLSVMKEVLRVKFYQHEYVRRVLQSTGYRYIADDSEDNHLGKLWMEIRSEMFTKHEYEQK